MFIDRSMVVSNVETESIAIDASLLELNEHVAIWQSDDAVLFNLARSQHSAVACDIKKGDSLGQQGDIGNLEGAMIFGFVALVKVIKFAP